MTPQFRVLGGSCPRHEETVETLFPVIFLGRAAENNVGPGGRVHDMRTMWSPYDQSCNLGGPASKKVGPEDRVHDMGDTPTPTQAGCCENHQSNSIFQTG